jgi:hypothetical protein
MTAVPASGRLPGPNAAGAALAAGVATRSTIVPIMAIIAATTPMERRFRKDIWKP